MIYLHSLTLTKNSNSTNPYSLYIPTVGGSIASNSRRDGSAPNTPSRSKKSGTTQGEGRGRIDGKGKGKHRYGALPGGYRKNHRSYADAAVTAKAALEQRTEEQVGGPPTHPNPEDDLLGYIHPT